MDKPNQPRNQGMQVDTTATLPLVVDLDGTLTPTDTLVESIIKLVKQSPLYLLRLPMWLLKGRAGFKDAVAAHVSIDVARLPYHEALLSYLRSEKGRGRRIVLATAAHKSIANGVAAHLGLFDDVLASDAGHNLKGTAKLEAICQRYNGEYVYAGDSQADLPIWKAAKAAVLVGVAPAVAKTVRSSVTIEQEFPKAGGGLADWLYELRVHQWLKNLLLFVPLLTAFSFTELHKLATMAIAFLSFSLAASATYVVNDLLDLDSDRAHPRKRLRPFANAKLSILRGLVVAALALVLAIVLAMTVSKGFLLMLLLYVMLTSAYSWTLKQQVLIDVLMLSILYTLRILAGSVAVGIVTSTWLLAFSVFVFLSLALVKRCAELVTLEQKGVENTRGRDYRVGDLVVLWPLGVGAALSAVVVFGLFISAPETQERYAMPSLLWLAAIGLVYWLARLWIKTSRGEMHDDPMIYAIKDRGSRLTVLAIIIITLIAHSLSFEPAS
jgi:4-hydroxybenzoate polyprenyltransferase/phosphoserine phosphatase